MEGSSVKPGQPSAREKTRGQGLNSGLVKSDHQQFLSRLFPLQRGKGKVFKVVVCEHITILRVPPDALPTLLPRPPLPSDLPASTAFSPLLLPHVPFSPVHHPAAPRVLGRPVPHQAPTDTSIPPKVPIPGSDPWHQASPSLSTLMLPSLNPLLALLLTAEPSRTPLLTTFSMPGTQ